MGGDLADMPSLASYDKGRKSFQGRTYKADIEAALEFNTILWDTVRAAKKKMPYRVILEGNHEYRIKRAIDLQPELDGTISFDDFQFDKFYDKVVPYAGSSPGVITVDEIHYAHYFISGVMGRPISGEHPAYSLITKQYSSCSAGHIHTADYCIRTDAVGCKLYGLLGGCFFDYDATWAGEANKLYWRGCVIKDNVDKGTYDPKFISLASLKKDYS